MTMLGSETAPPGGEVILRARNVSKTFGAVTVLRSVDLDIRAGEVHGLVGQNGSGKSTFIKVLSGFLAPDDGASLELGGVELELPVREAVADEARMSFVHQDLALVDRMSVLDNIRLGQWSTRAGAIRRRAELRRVRELLDRFELSVAPDTLVERLSQAEKAVLALIRATDRIAGRAGSVLVLDEPTAYLPRDGVRRLFDAVEKVTSTGSGVLFVSHRLDEVLEHTDRITVFRDGRAVHTGDTTETSEEELVTQILGRALTDLYPHPAAHPPGELRLSVRGLTGDVVDGLSFDVHSGEIVGVTGLAGMGQDEIPYLVYGSRTPAAGEVGFPEAHHGGRSIAASIDARVVLVPADRVRDGGIAQVSMRDNVSLPVLGRYRRLGTIDRRREAAATDRLLGEFGVQPHSFSLPMTSFSGGNQQKGILAKWLQTGPRVLIMHEPTQGVDVGSRKQIFGVIREVADSGVAVLIVSAEYEDMAHLCDRVFVLRDGRPTAELAGAALTTESLIERCYVDRGTGGRPAAATGDPVAAGAEGRVG